MLSKSKFALAGLLVAWAGVAAAATAQPRKDREVTHLVLEDVPFLTAAAPAIVYDGHLGYQDAPQAFGPAQATPGTVENAQRPQRRGDSDRPELRP